MTVPSPRAVSMKTTRARAFIYATKATAPPHRMVGWNLSLLRVGSVGLDERTAVPDAEGQPAGLGSFSTLNEARSLRSSCLVANRRLGKPDEDRLCFRNRLVLHRSLLQPDCNEWTRRSREPGDEDPTHDAPLLAPARSQWDNRPRDYPSTSRLDAQRKPNVSNTRTAKGMSGCSLPQRRDENRDRDKRDRAETPEHGPAATFAHLGFRTFFEVDGANEDGRA